MFKIFIFHLQIPQEMCDIHSTIKYIPYIVVGTWLITIYEYKIFEILLSKDRKGEIIYVNDRKH